MKQIYKIFSFILIVISLFILNELDSLASHVVSEHSDKTHSMSLASGIGYDISGSYNRSKGSSYNESVSDYAGITGFDVNVTAVDANIIGGIIAGTNTTSASITNLTHSDISLESRSKRDGYGFSAEGITPSSISFENQKNEQAGIIRATIADASVNGINHDTSHIESWITLKKHNYSLYSPVPSEKNLTHMYRAKKDISDVFRDIRRGDGEATEIISGELGGYFGERNSGLKQALAEDFEDAYYEDIKLGRDKKLSVTSTKKALWNLTDSLYKLEIENGGIEYQGSYFSYHIPYDTEDASIVWGIRAGRGLYKLSSYALRKLAKDSLKDAESGVVTLVKERAATSTPAPGGMEPDDDEGKGKLKKENYKLEQDKQDKHIPGTNNFKPFDKKGQKKSILTSDAKELYDKYAGKGVPGGNKMINTPGYKETFDTGKEVIGVVFIDDKPVTTTRGTIHFSKDGYHIVPSYNIK